MSATTSISTNFEDSTTVVNDLLLSLPDPGTADGLGFLFCDSQLDFQAVLEGVTKKVGFPLVGGTALAFPFADPGGSELSAALLFFSKEGMKSAVAVSDVLEQGRHEEQMQAVYEQCLERLGTEPRLVLPFFPLMPGLITGHFIDALFSLAGGVPVFGGTTTNDLVGTKAAVFAEGKAMGNRMALVMLGGSIQPAFSTSNLVTPMVEYAPEVTGAEGNEVLTVDNGSFCDHMRDVGISPEDRINGVDALMQYGPTPAIMQAPDRPEDDVPEVRCISFTNVQKGSAMFSGPVPEGTRLRMSVLRKEDVAHSTRECLQKLQTRMRAAQDAGYRYSALLCVTCVARYFVLVGGANVERELLTVGMPDGMAGLGFYAFCEIGPAYTLEEQRLVNRSHSASITMCAL